MGAYLTKLVLLLLWCIGSALYADPATGRFTISLRVFPPVAALSIDGLTPVPTEICGNTRSYEIPGGRHAFVLTAGGYHQKEMVLDITHHTEIEEKLERRYSTIQKISEVGTGSGPKSVMFTREGQFLIVALLFGNGVDVFSLNPLHLAKSVLLDGDTTGFVELAYNESRAEIWVSQMLTNSIHVLDADSFEPLRAIDSGGVWPKVIAFSPDDKTAYASHWRTFDVSIIDVYTSDVRGVIPVTGIPRGLAVSSDSEVLYIANFSNGGLEIVNTTKLQIAERIEGGGKAMRHIVIDTTSETAYGSDMYRGRIAKIDLNSKAVVWSARLASNPNTIVLTPGGKYLFVSCRGKNNEANWHARGVEYGKIFVLDTDTLEIVDWLWGRNQPTGLAVSPDGTLLAFTNFYDNTIELYRIDL